MLYLRRVLARGSFRQAAVSSLGDARPVLRTVIGQCGIRLAGSAGGEGGVGGELETGTGRHFARS